jgi:hypothetical protein
MKFLEAKRTIALPLVIPILILFHTAGLRAGPAVQAWVERYHGPVNSSDGAAALAVDLAGNVYVTGSSAATNGFFDYATIAYSSAGAALWTNRYHGAATNANYYPNAIAVDGSNGNVYVTGEIDGFGGATIAYSSSGAALWTNLFYGGADALAVGVGRSGNVYVGGTPGGMEGSCALVAYAASGTPLWTNLYRHFSEGYASINALALDAQDNVYVTGASEDQDLSTHGTTLAYSGAGTPLWTNRYYDSLGGGIDGFFAAGVDASNGNVYVTGYSYDGEQLCSTVAYSSAGTPLWTNLYYGSGYENALAVDSSRGTVYITADVGGYITLAYSSAGTPLWTNFYSAGSNIGASASAVAVDSNGNVIVSGYSYADGANLGYVTIAYSSSGIPLWTNIYKGPGNTGGQVPGPFCLGVGPGGAVYVTGTSGGTDGTDYATVKYVPAPDILFSAINRLPNATCQLMLSAPTNVAYRLDASADLTNWLTLTNFPPLPATSLQYTDTLAPGFPTRFYRTVWPP